MELMTWKEWLVYVSIEVDGYEYFSHHLHFNPT